MMAYYRGNVEELNKFIFKNQGRIKSVLSLYLTTREERGIISRYISIVGKNEYQNFLKSIAEDEIIDTDPDGSFVTKDGDSEITLGVEDLSTSQRGLLYLKACLVTGNKVAIAGIAECLDVEHRKIFNKIVSEDSDNLISVLFLDRHYLLSEYNRV